MIELYYWPTPNGHKITIFLEEAALPYRIVPVDISAGDQFKPEFLAISPNNRMPAIIDHAPADGGAPISVFESGAILVYLAEKIGRFLPTALRSRKTVFEWLFWQVGGLGPMAGQNHHFVQYAPESIPYAIDRYVRETSRLYAVLDRRLAEVEWVAGTTPSRIWRSIRGSFRTNGNGKTSTISPTSSVGSNRCRHDRRSPVPTPAENRGRNGAR